MQIQCTFLEEEFMTIPQIIESCAYTLYAIRSENKNLSIYRVYSFEVFIWMLLTLHEWLIIVSTHALGHVSLITLYQILLMLQLCGQLAISSNMVNCKGLFIYSYLYSLMFALLCLLPSTIEKILNLVLQNSTVDALFHEN